ncbi:MAG: hypothetical protein KC561_05720, partial [Myxococcales bacterium]|nr:hypothetical protein [Myxococcales bacterium]
MSGGQVPVWFLLACALFVAGCADCGRELAGCTEACTERGECGFSNRGAGDHAFRCFVDSSESCQRALVCGAEGRCHYAPAVHPAQCVAVADSDCEQSTACLEDGRCFRQFDGSCGESAPVGDEPSLSWCEEQDECRLLGRCSAHDGLCVAGSPSECEQSLGCEYYGACGLSGGFCVASSDDSCGDSTECRLYGRCRVSDDGGPPVCVGAQRSRGDGGYCHMNCLAFGACFSTPGGECQTLEEAERWASVVSGSSGPPGKAPDSGVPNNTAPPQPLDIPTLQPDFSITSEGCTERMYANFGRVLAASNDWIAAVGSDDGVSGELCVGQVGSSGVTWTQLLAADPELSENEGTYFGADLAMFERTLAVGQINDGQADGPVLFFERRDGVTYELVSELLPALDDPDAPGSDFGFSIAGDGSAALIG